MINGNNNFEQKDEYIFIDDSQDLFRLQAATTTSWANKFIEKAANKDSILIFYILENNLNKIAVSKGELNKISKIYSLIRIYYNKLYINLIVSREDEQNTILIKVKNFSEISKKIENNLKINFNHNYSIKEKNVIVENFEKIYELEDKIKNNPLNNDEFQLIDELNSDSSYTFIKKNINNNFKVNLNINLPKDYIKQAENAKMNYQSAPDKLSKMNNLNNLKNIFNQESNSNNMKTQKNVNNNWQNNNNNHNNISINMENLMRNNLNMPKPISQNNMPNNMNNQMQNNLNMPKHNSQNNMPNNMNNQMQNNLNMPKHNSQNNMPNNMNNQMQNNNILTVDMYESEIEQLANQYFKKYFFKGYEQSFFPTKGLNNVGLTCYMNSTLQFLLHIPELNTFFFNAYPDFLKQPNYKKIIEKVASEGRLSQEFNNLLKKTIGFIEDNRFFQRNNSVAPYEFNSLISSLNPQFARYESNDARDLLIYLLQEMHEELNYFGHKRLKKVPRCNQLIELNAFNFFKQVNSEMNFSIISYLFWGIVKQTTVCQVCNFNLYNFQYFQYLSFPLYSYQGQDFNFYRGLKDYIKPELLSGDNQFFCQNCGRLRDAHISSKIFYTSPYLIINFDYGKGKKYIPDKINFGAFIRLTKEFLDKVINDVKYELVAVTTHIGSSGNSGHYIAFCKDHKNNWHKFNDSSHTICSFEETKSYSPYLLLFKKNKSD